MDRSPPRLIRADFILVHTSIRGGRTGVKTAAAANVAHAFKMVTLKTEFDPKGGGGQLRVGISAQNVFVSM